MNAEEFAQLVLAQSDLEKDFAPFSVYDHDGDCIEFIAKPDAYFAERVDGIVTVYYSEESNEMIGAQIKGIKSLMRQSPGLSIEVHDGPVRLHFLLRARIWREDPKLAKISVIKYKKLISLAEASDAKVDLHSLVA
jgi:hypothetical protein